MQDYSDVVLNLFRTRQDPDADAVISAYFPRDKSLLKSHLDSLVDNGSAIPNDAHLSLKKLFKDMRLEASKFDETELENGQIFFSRNASDIMLLLGFMSLPYCYAAANGAEVLVRSKRILEDPASRLMDTASFVFDVTNDKAFTPKGAAMISILRVRLLHAATRWYINNSGDWDSKKFGKPINQEDMAGTNLSFSLMTVRGLRKLGKFVTPKSAFQYIDYWNKIGLLLGLAPELLPKSNRDTFALERNIRVRQFGPSESGRKLTTSLLKYYEYATKDSPLEGFSKSFMNFLLGDKVSRMIDLEVKDYDRLVFKPYKLFTSFRTFFFKSQDSYAKAFARFKENKA